ncbi:glycerophosphodiester phosphodiesterase [Paenactinomyces guangxiensis]|uniref:Glycerophosphodiester phosphodiesterase n=1 Tax=Paenactinomyces guangxiensis TaxID=1490290 RepID=A0A7W1WQN4_9BACL|nr:glycerophosphodiester phosphodiesterase [Paenactinomyces guangxiensis]MBA4494286.1 glycerophosphodiester phosphodiesterase [Paenactinomyces guangxiensis]MBH8590780.1 glycerophosphodiester phosphodiesterase [Paenactinomyces guangxiensis]
MTKVFAHRGFSAIAPENTLAAFRMAIDAGADGIELDVHMTRDGEIVVIHDEKVDRTTDGTGWVKDFTLPQIKELDSGNWFAEAYAGERIPTLAETLELIKDTGLRLNIELKNNVFRYPGIEEKVAKEVERFALQKRVIISSFNHYSLRYFKLYRPDWQLGALYAAGLYEPWVYAKHLGVSAIHPFYLAAADEVIAGCHTHGIQVRPYTVDDPGEMSRLIAANVDAIITNVPDRLMKLIRSGE